MSDEYELKGVSVTGHYKKKDSGEGWGLLIGIIIGFFILKAMFGG